MLSFVGGTGPEGMGLAVRFLLAGEDVIIGSRSAERASDAAKKLRSLLEHRASDRPATSARVEGSTNEEALKGGDIVIVTVPFQAQADILEALKDQIGERVVVDTVVPLQFTKGISRAVPVEEGSAAQQAQIILPRATVISAFQNLSAETLIDIDQRLECDVVVCGDDKDAKSRIMELVGRIEGIREIDGGGLANSRYVEEFTALLLNINKIYKAHSSLKITGI